MRFTGIAELMMYKNNLLLSTIYKMAIGTKTGCICLVFINLHRFHS
jgi:hypothetical protein